MKIGNCVETKKICNKPVLPNPEVAYDRVKYRILIVHNAYQMYGGEDAVVEAELNMLRRNGHEVEMFRRHNDELAFIPNINAAVDTLWSRNSGARLRAAIQNFRPDLVHCHNTFPLISPSAYWAVYSEGVPLVQTLHNFRLHCPQAMYLRNKEICQACLGHLPWRSVLYGCYRGSKAQSALITGMLALHRTMHTYQKKVTLYIALNEFCRGKFIEGGLPADRIVIKPNFVHHPPPPPSSTERNGFVFIGRLSTEKGLDVLMRAWNSMDAGSLRIAGTGPEGPNLSERRGLQLLGLLNADEVRSEMLRSSALVLPSISYDSFPLTLVEAYASGLPVIASRLGSFSELIEDGVTGLLFERGNAYDLARKLIWAQTHPVQLAQMGRRARMKYEAEFSEEINYQRLIEIYDQAIRTVLKEDM